MLLGKLISSKIGKWEGISGKIIAAPSITYYELRLSDTLILSWLIKCVKAVSLIAMHYVMVVSPNGGFTKSC